MQEQIIGQLVSNSILTTALLSNELCVQSKGEFIIPENDYVAYVRDFQVIISRSLHTVITNEILKQEAKKYISELLLKYQESSNAESDTVGDIEQSSVSSKNEG